MKILLSNLRRLDDRLHRRVRGARRKVLFDGETSMHFSMFETLYGCLLRDERVQCRITSSWDGGFQLPSADIGRMLGAGPEAAAPYGRAKWRKWDLYVSSCFDNPWLARNVPRVDTFHGVGEKWVAGGERLYMCHPLAAQYDRLFCPNRRLARQFEARPQFLKTPRSACVTGLAKSDVLAWFNTDAVRGALRGALPLKPGRPVVLFAPTWGTDGALARHWERVADICLEADVNLIVKLHACSYLHDEKYTGGVDWHARMEAEAAARGFLHLPHAHLTSLILLADVMIADFGSAPVEFCLVDRPLLFFAVPEQAARTGGDHFQFNSLCAAGNAVTDGAGLAPKLQAALRGEDAAAPRRRAVTEEFFHAPGAATENCLREMYALMELDCPAGLVERYKAGRGEAILSDPARFLGTNHGLSGGHPGAAGRRGRVGP